MQRLLALVRWERWSTSKLPMLVAAYALALGERSPSLESALLGAALLGSHILGYASFGYLANSLADVEQDIYSGKGSVLFGWSRIRGSMAVLVAAGFALLPLLAAPSEHSYALVSALIALGVAAAYSLHPFRLKERGVLGVVSSSLAQRTLPAMTVFAYFDALSWAAATYLVLTFVIGIRFILVHQADDITSDRISGTRTLATRIGLHRTEHLIARVVLPMEFGASGIWIVSTAATLGPVAPALGAYLAVHLVMLLGLRRWSKFPLAGYAPLSEFYSTYVPIGCAIAGLLLAGRFLAPAFAFALVLAAATLPASLLEEFHRTKRLLGRNRKSRHEAYRQLVGEAMSAGVQALSSMQKVDGSFELIKWAKNGRPTPAHHLFASAWVLIAAHEFLSRDAILRAAGAISRSRNPDGTWNFDPSLKIPNDADSTSCALLALEIAGSPHAESDRALLGSQWRADRQRFATWFSNDEQWRSAERDDPVVNLNILALLQTGGAQSAEAERIGIQRYVATVPPTSRYYCDPMAIPYAAFKAGVPIDRTRHRAWGRPGSRSTSISIAHWLTITETHDDSLVALLLSRQRADGSWPAEPWFTGVNVPFWGSQAVTTAYCIEALHAVESRLIRSR